MKNELDGQTKAEFAGVWAKPHRYLKDNNEEETKGKGTKKCAIQGKLKFQDYKNSLEAAQIENNKKKTFRKK